MQSAARFHVELVLVVICSLHQGNNVYISLQCKWPVCPFAFIITYKYKYITTSRRLVTTSAPREVQNIVTSMSVCLYVRSHISKTTRSQLHQIFVHVDILWGHSGPLCHALSLLSSLLLLLSSLLWTSILGVRQ